MDGWRGSSTGRVHPAPPEKGAQTAGATRTATALSSANGHSHDGSSGAEDPHAAPVSAEANRALEAKVQVEAQSKRESEPSEEETKEGDGGELGMRAEWEGEAGGWERKQVSEAEERNGTSDNGSGRGIGSGSGNGNGNGRHHPTPSAGSEQSAAPRPGPVEGERERRESDEERGQREKGAKQGEGEGHGEAHDNGEPGETRESRVVMAGDINKPFFRASERHMLSPPPMVSEGALTPKDHREKAPGANGQGAGGGVVGKRRGSVLDGDGAGHLNTSGYNSKKTKRFSVKWWRRRVLSLKWWQRKLKDIAVSERLGNFIVAMILVNTLLMGMDHDCDLCNQVRSTGRPQPRLPGPRATFVRGTKLETDA